MNRTALIAALALAVPALAAPPKPAGTHPCQQNKPMVEVSCAMPGKVPNGGYTGYTIKRCGRELFGTSWKRSASAENWPVRHLGYRDYANNLGWSLSVNMSDKAREGSDQEGWNYPATCVNCFPSDQVAAAALKSKFPHIAHMTCRVHAPPIPEQEPAKKK
jgi:hypothetical protein